MKRLQAFKYELQPNGQQAGLMNRFAGSCRFVFNKALALQKENHSAGEKFINYVSMAKHLTAWRNGKETPWLKHSERIVRRITSDLTNPRLEGMNSLFQAARTRARGYRNTKNFINMIYLLGSPIEVQVQSGKYT